MKKLIKIICISALSLTILAAAVLGVEKFAGASTATKVINANLPKFADGKATVQGYKSSWNKQTLKDVSYKVGEFELVFTTLTIHRSLPDLLFSKIESYKNLQPAASNCKIFYKNKELAVLDKIHFDLKNDTIVLLGKPKSGDDHSTVKIIVHTNQAPLIEVSLQNIPTNRLDKFLRNTPMKDIVGDRVSVLASFYPSKLQTNTEIQLHSPNLSFKTAGIIKDGNFLMKEPLIGSFFIRESLSQKFFTNSETTLASLDPVLIHVDPENTIIPIVNASWDKLEAPKVSIDFGRVQCNRFYALNTLLSIMNLEVNLNISIPTKIEETTLSIQHGVCKFDKTHFVVNDQYPLISWGTYDLQANKLDMQLGVAKPFLEKSLGYKNLPKDFTISLRVTGTLEEPVYHVENTIVDIAELALRQKLPIQVSLEF